VTLAVVTLTAVGIGPTGLRLAGATPVCPNPPVLNEDDYTVGFGQPLKVSAPGLLANDTGTSLLVEVSDGQIATNPDPSDDFSLFGNATIRYGDPFGSRNRQGGFTYTPDTDPENPFSGIDQFDYWAIDACRNDDLATAFITVVPTVVDSTYSTQINAELDVPAATGFLANDHGVDAFSMFYDFTSAQGGSVDDAGAGDGSFTYTPPPDFSGMDSFGYQVDDINGDNTYFGTVHIQVGNGPTAPTTVTATGGNHQASVAFSGATTSGAPISSYTATASPGGQTATGSASPLVVTGLTNGTTYHFTVHAASTDGTSIESVQSNAVVPDDGLPPVVSTTAPVGPFQLTTNVAAAWHATDSSGIASYDARRAIAAWNGSLGAWTTWNAALATSTTYTASPGHSYCFEARATDNAAHVSGWTTPHCVAMPLRSDQITYTSSFKKATAAAAYAGFEYTTKSHGAVMTRTGIVGKRVAIVLAKCSTCGTVQVRWNGTTIANLDMHSSVTLHKQVVTVGNWSTAHSGTLTATVTSPTGQTVAIEGLGVYNS